MCTFIFKLLCPGTRLKVKMGMKKNKMFSPVMTHFVAKVHQHRLTAEECVENTFYPEVQDELLTPMFGFASAFTVVRNTALELCKSQN